MSAIPKPARPRRSVLMRVMKGAIVPADAYALEALRKRRYSLGQLVSAELKAARNPQFFRKVHALATCVIENIEDFGHYSAHADEHEVLKRLQIEADLACDHIRIDGGFVCRIPRSLSFESMEEPEFADFYTKLCSYLAVKYWPDLDEAAIERMAQFSGEAA